MRTAHDEKQCDGNNGDDDNRGKTVAGEIPGAPVIGELVPRGEHTIVVR